MQLQHRRALSHKRAGGEFFAEWMNLRANNGHTDTEIEANTRRMDDLARLICVTPARTGNDVLRKIEVLEWQLDLEAECHMVCADHRAIPMLAGIKADLLRYELKDTRGGCAVA